MNVQQCQDKLKEEEESSLEEPTNKEEYSPTLVMEMETTVTEMAYSAKDS